MRTMNLTVAAAGAFAVVLAASSAGAQCLSAAGWKAIAKPAAWSASQGEARLLRTVNGGGQFGVEPGIVGMWHVKLVAASAVNAPVPPGAEVDAGYQQWHSDGTEMLNSGRPAANGSFCMGVWEQVGPRTFKLNHFAISWTQGPAPDSSSGPTNSRTGPTTISEEVTVSLDGRSFSGNFTITDYAETDTPGGSSISFLDSITGTVTGTRITVNTPVSPIF